MAVSMSMSMSMAMPSITHTTKTSVADIAFENDIEALLAARDFVDFVTGPAGQQVLRQAGFGAP